MFMETIQQAGLNPYLFEMANIRDQDSWVHMHEPEKALDKAKDLIRGVAARLTNLEPLHKMEFPVTKSALVIGGGVAGMESALSIANMGFESYLVEKGDKLGGNAWNLVTSHRGYDYRGYLEELIKKVDQSSQHPGAVQHRRHRDQRFHGQLQVLRDKPRPASRQLLHGVTIMATGGKPHSPEEYLYGQHDNVFLAFDLDKAMVGKDPRVTGAKQRGLHPVRGLPGTRAALLQPAVLHPFGG